MHHIRYVGSSEERTGGESRHSTESGCNVDKLEEMQWCVVRQKNGSEPEGKCLQNCDQTSTVVWYRDLATARGQEARP